jgi:Na+/H+ antiporter NhaD/arsenite permease-like protein
LGLGLTLTLSKPDKQALAQVQSPLIVGSVFDKQGQPVEGATVILSHSLEGEPIAEVETQPNGRFAFSLWFEVTEHLVVRIERAHFANADIELDSAAINILSDGRTLVLKEVILEREIRLAFWIATLIFMVVLIFIATGRLHNTLAALVGAASILFISYLGHPISEDFFIFDFNRALSYVDWNVVGLIMGMMIVIALVERTGIFQWLAFNAYRLSGGRMWLLLPILMFVTGVASAFLDNVTTMLLMTPITIEIAIALGINPLALLMPEVMASNVLGISTLVGTPTNILIGSYAGLTFNDFLTNLTPGVLLAMVGLIIYSEISYRKDLKTASSISPVLLDKLAEHANITEPEQLKKAGWVGLGMLVMFVFGERIHLLPAVTALIGATALLLWVRPDIEEMIEAVDWTTLVFFIGLFVVVGAIQEVGLISIIADVITQLVGGQMVVAMLVVTWSAALLSTVVANIPFTAAMLPVIRYLTAIVPGAAQNNVLFYCLSVGSAMGGNGSLIGASANMVTAGISERAGYPITYSYFLKKGMPALLITVTLATLWLFKQFL